MISWLQRTNTPLGRSDFGKLLKAKMLQSTANRKFSQQMDFPLYDILTGVSQRLRVLLSSRTDPFIGPTPAVGGAAAGAAGAVGGVVGGARPNLSRAVPV